MALIVAVVVWAVAFGAFAGSGEAVFPPRSVSGPTMAAVGDEVDFTAVGGFCTMHNAPVEYQITWGDGSDPSPWFAETLFATHVYTSPGDYEIIGRARCTVDHEQSGACAKAQIHILAAGEEVIGTPSAPQGYPKVLVGQENTYQAFGGLSNLGHEVEYSFSWGDGSADSLWSTDASAKHIYTAVGIYAIKAHSRCRAHPDKQSAWSDTYWQTVSLAFSIVAPMTPNCGMSHGVAGRSYDFTTFGAVADCGDPVQYQFDWGDGTHSDWCDGHASHIYGLKGNYSVRAKAQCPIHRLTSSYSPDFVIVMDDPEKVTAPTKPVGPADLRCGQALVFQTGGATDNYKNPLEYQFSWGDRGPDSDWLQSPQATHIYAAPGVYTVKARARCLIYPEIVSGYSPGLSATVLILEHISQPDPPDGPDYVRAGEAASYSAARAVSDLGHDLQYQFTWGDGTQSSWGPATQSHVWQTPVNCDITVQARCAQHNYITSPASLAHRISVGTAPPEVISPPTSLDGPATGLRGDTLTFTASGSISNLGHSVGYEFDWGDHSPTMCCSGSGVGQHAYASAGNFTIQVRAVCGVDTNAASDWVPLKGVHIIAGYHCLTTSVEGCGTITLAPQKDQYEEGEQVTLTATGAHGWRFHHWEDGAAGSTNPVVVTVNADTHVTAVFGEGDYNLVTNTDGPGTIHRTPDRLAFRDGEWVQLVAFPADGYTFQGWTGSLTGADNPVLLEMHSDQNITAHFTPKACQLQVVIYPDGGGTVSVDPQKASYAYGEHVTLTATEAAGHQFNHWGGDIFSTTNPVDVTINGDMRIKCLFSLTTSVHWPIPAAQSTWIDVYGGISLCGEPAAAGDEIAALTPGGVVCGQFTVIDPEGEYGVMRIWGDDPATTDVVEGAAPGDVLTFKHWDSVQDKETALEAVITGNSASVVWTQAGDLLAVQLASACEERIPLSEGWNLFSFRTDRCFYTGATPPTVPLLEGTLPVSSTVKDALASIDGHYTAVRGFDQTGAHTYDPTCLDESDLRYLAPGYGYWIRMTAPGTLVLNGGRVRPCASLPLQAGWNLRGCWAKDAVYTGSTVPWVSFSTPPVANTLHVNGGQALLPDLIGRYDVMRSFDATGAHTLDPTLPDFLSDLDYVGPGYGYWLKMRMPTLLSY
jgi:uncharacterized repeat protein (TIGR02543 family)